MNSTFIRIDGPVNRRQISQNSFATSNLSINNNFYLYKKPEAVPAPTEYQNEPMFFFGQKPMNSKQPTSHSSHKFPRATNRSIERLHQNASVSKTGLLSYQDVSPDKYKERKINNVVFSKARRSVYDIQFKSLNHDVPISYLHQTPNDIASIMNKS